jgi:hypothetical protein
MLERRTIENGAMIEAAEAKGKQEKQRQESWPFIKALLLGQNKGKSEEYHQKVRLDSEANES